MDVESALVGAAGAWTDERHAAFLHCMEQSFVRRMLADARRPPASSAPRLDRHLPDSATESNQGSSARRAAASTDHRGKAEFGVLPRDRRMSRSSRVRDESEDQVVPELGDS